MTNKNFQFSTTVKNETETKGEIIISPLPSGFGHTIGHGLRRVLLGSIPGAAITKIKVKGASHIFSTIGGLKEDLVEVMLNLKRVRFAYSKKEPIILKLKKKGIGEVKASDIQLQPKVKIGNPDLVLAHLSSAKTTFSMELTVETGVGFQPAEEHKSNILGVIGIDSSFSPVKGVNFTVEPIRKGKKDNFDKLILKLITDGSISPSQAVKDAAEILTTVFNQIISPAEIEKKETKKKEENKNLDLMVEEIDEIPLRLSNALKKVGYQKISDLVKAGVEDVSKAKNVGGKSIDLIKKVLKKYKVDFK